jgi:hypothetical protein
VLVINYFAEKWQLVAGILFMFIGWCISGSRGALWPDHRRAQIREFVFLDKFGYF